jgi:hypothetical protein
MWTDDVYIREGPKSMRKDKDDDAGGGDGGG